MIDSFIYANAGDQFQDINNMTGSETLNTDGYHIYTGTHDANVDQMQLYSMDQLDGGENRSCSYQGKMTSAIDYIYNNYKKKIFYKYY